MVFSDTVKEAEQKLNETIEKPIQKKSLPDLDRYWKAVNDDPSDFTAWTYLLQYVEQENDIEAAREAYDAFLANYPYCYGYWRKYADYEKRKGNKKKCEEVSQMNFDFNGLVLIGKCIYTVVVCTQCIGHRRLHQAHTHTHSHTHAHEKSIFVFIVLFYFVTYLAIAENIQLFDQVSLSKNHFDSQLHSETAVLLSCTRAPSLDLMHSATHNVNTVFVISIQIDLHPKMYLCSIETFN